ncbi:hypothetical protein AVEN_263689-1 [Araneus ventricosus]|uniref:Cullin N-terminal domain-containing protein n=1 Tax=Araneus ventricosus TaxID=182803 RepID=A0A4Y2AU03_ARAVE|nr:hypothetical protein AVEN_263689-1 [Araneus ventricosus]
MTSTLFLKSIPKKLVIRNFEKPTLPENYIAEASEKLKNAIIAIQASEYVHTSQEELYNAVENLCSHQMAKILYINLQSLIETHIQKNLKPLLKYPF